MINTMRQTMIDIADKYCELYGVTRHDLFQKGNHKNAVKKRVVNGVNVATIRMALGYYLSNNFPVSLSEVAGLIGYNDHSTLSYNNKKIYFYIKNSDQYFMSYYYVLQEIGKLHPTFNITRIHKKNFAILN